MSVVGVAVYMSRAVLRGWSGWVWLNLITVGSAVLVGMDRSRELCSQIYQISRLAKFK